MKNAFFKFTNKLIFVFLALLGFATSCEKGLGEVADAYGTPMADFITKGTVKSAKTNQTISNIRVIMSAKNVNCICYSDTTFTNASGIFELKVKTDPTMNVYSLKFEDTDGANNGIVVSKDSTITFSDKFSGGDGNWYSGKQEKTINIQLDSEK